MFTGYSRMARGVSGAATTRSCCTATVAVQVPDGHPGCAACWHGAPTWCATDETTAPDAGGMAQPWEDGMAPNADDGASHNTVTANRVAITRLPAVRAGLVNRSPGALCPAEDCRARHEEIRKDA
jgi:hypothetical protein